MELQEIETILETGCILTTGTAQEIEKALKEADAAAVDPFSQTYLLDLGYRFRVAQALSDGISLGILRED